MSRLEDLCPLLCLQSDGAKNLSQHTVCQKVPSESTVHFMKHVQNQQINYKTRPLGPVQPSAPPACLWQQERDQGVLGEGAGRVAGAGVEDGA